MIPLMKNAFLDEYETKQKLAQFIIREDRLSMGEQSFKFEREFADFQGCQDAIFVNSGGSANLAMLQALKNLGRLKSGDKIGFSALTWSTNVMPILQLGMTPVAIDCDPNSLNVMSAQLLQRIEAVDIQAFFVTNVLGFAGNLEEIRRICVERNIILIEDNCESLGTELPAGKCGNFGVMASFSFFVAHHMSTIEGGMIATNDVDLAEMLRMVRANGWDRNLTANQQQRLRKQNDIRSEFDAKYTFYDLAYNIRPTEISAFIGRTQLPLLNKNIDIREANYLILEKVVKNNDELISIDRSHLRRLSNFAFPVMCKSPKLRDKYVAEFSGAGVEVRPMIAGNIQSQPFYRKYVSELYELPGADMVHECGFYCGNYPELSIADIEILSSCLMQK